jgi:DNA-binding SARP family transcriptional activator
VSAKQLIIEIWGDRAPKRAAAGLHVYVSELRRFLARPDRPAQPIITRPAGYLLQLGSDELDLHAFLRLMGFGRAAMKRRDFEQASHHFTGGLALWRGAVLEDFGAGPIISGLQTSLAESWMELTEMLIECRLALGCHRELIGSLYSLIDEYPLREAFYRLLMVALYRSERQADALKVYHVARTVLGEELGLEPCQALQGIHRAILRSDDGLLDVCMAA